MRSGIWINTQAATMPKHVTVRVWSLGGRWAPSELGQDTEPRADLLALQRWPSGLITPQSPLYFLSPSRLPSLLSSQDKSHQ